MTNMQFQGDFSAYNLYIRLCHGNKQFNLRDWALKAQVHQKDPHNRELRYSAFHITGRNYA